LPHRSHVMCIMERLSVFASNIVYISIRRRFWPPCQAEFEKSCLLRRKRPAPSMRETHPGKPHCAWRKESRVMVGPVLYQEMLLGSRHGRWHRLRWVYAGWHVVGIGWLV